VWPRRVDTARPTFCRSVIAGFLLEGAPDHDQHQAHGQPDDHGDETGIGHEYKILFVGMISLAGCLIEVAGWFRQRALDVSQQYLTLPAPL
jgi:hypothetical protein